MKNFFASAMLILMISTASLAKMAVAKGKTHSELGNYRIEKANESIKINGQDCKTFKIRYANSPMEVTVAVIKDKLSRKYLVLSDKLSIQYSWNKYYFGVERIDKSLNAQGFRTTDENLNRSEYFHQKLIGPGLLMDRESARLIAAYFPFLLVPDETMVAAR